MGEILFYSGQNGFQESINDVIDMLLVVWKYTEWIVAPLVIYAKGVQRCLVVILVESLDSILY